MRKELEELEDITACGHLAHLQNLTCETLSIMVSVPGRSSAGSKVQKQICFMHVCGNSVRDAAGRSDDA